MQLLHKLFHHIYLGYFRDAKCGSPSGKIEVNSTSDQYKISIGLVPFIGTIFGIILIKAWQHFSDVSGQFCICSRHCKM